ncbi:MAG: entericidin A/B family lipoprotein [Erythrobacter sp.]|mgnify:CR=1 FL=1
MKSHTIGKSLTLAALAALTLTATAACNTVKGAGEDISSVGRAGERAIKKN